MNEDRRENFFPSHSFIFIKIVCIKKYLLKYTERVIDKLFNTNPLRSRSTSKKNIHTKHFETSCDLHHKVPLTGTKI